MKKLRKIFISATGQNDGKTVVSLGLICGFQERFTKVGFIKPIGQRYLMKDGEKVDEDSVLIGRACCLPCAIKDMSPIAVERGFTKRYILKSNKRQLTQRIKTSFKRVAKDKDAVIIEGTGHAGVGSVFDLSNATVARMLSTKVVIVSSGGIGRPIDEIMLNKALFEKEQVAIAGVIINKVRPGKYQQVNRMVRLGLERKGLEVLGVIPYKRMLSAPTISQVLAELNFKLLNNNVCLETRIDKILVGAMSPQDALTYFSDQSLIITPGDREDMILAVVGFQIERAEQGVQIAGIVLTGGLKPHRTVIDLVKRASIPLMLAPGDTYSVASKIHDLTVKIRPADTEKTGTVKDMIERYVDIDLLIQRLQ